MEAMLALAVLTGAILIVFQSFRSSLRFTAISRQSYQAALLLEDHIGTWEKTGGFNLESSEDPVLGTISWQKEEHPGSDASWHAERYKLIWGNGDHERQLELFTAVLD